MAEEGAVASCPRDEPAAESPFAAAPVERRWPLLAVVLGLHLIASLAIGVVVASLGDDYHAGVVLGVIFGQIALLAVWTAWAPVAAFWRFASGLLIFGFLALMLAAQMLRSPSDSDAALAFNVILLLQWALAQTPLWIARAWRGHRLVVVGKPGLDAPRRELQFGLGQLLALTGCVAILLAGARWVLSSESTSFDEWVYIIEGVVILAGFHSLAVVPAIWAALAARAIGAVTLTAFYVVGLTIAEVHTTEMALGAKSESVFFFVLNLTVFLVVTTTLLAVRWCGLRLTTSARG